MNFRMFFKQLSLAVSIVVGAHITQFEYTQWQYWVILAIVCAGIDTFVVLGGEK